MCHQAFLHTTAPMSGPFLQTKNLSLLGLPCACGSLQDCKPVMIIILFCAILCWSGAGGPYMLYDIEAIPTRTRSGLLLLGDTTGACDGKKRAACVMQMCRDFAITCFCTPRISCQDPSCKLENMFGSVWSAWPVPAEFCKIARRFILLIFPMRVQSFSMPFFASQVLESYTSFTTWNYPMKKYWSGVWEAHCMCHPLEAVSMLVDDLANRKANNCQCLQPPDWSAIYFPA